MVFFFNLGFSFVETLTYITTFSAKELIKMIKESKKDFIAKLMIGKLKNLKGRTEASVDLQLSRLTIFAADLQIRQALTVDDDFEYIDWNELNIVTTPLTIVIQIPQENLDVWKPLTQLLINQLIRTLERRPDKYSPSGSKLLPVLILCEEFGNLGKISSILKGLSTLRDRSVTFCLIVQSLFQLDDIYGEAVRRAIIDCISYFIILKILDPLSQKYFSEMIGYTSVMGKSIGASYGSFNNEMNNYSLRINEAQAPLVPPEEFGQLQDIILITPNGYFRIEKTRYIPMTPVHDLLELRLKNKSTKKEYPQ